MGNQLKHDIRAYMQSHPGVKYTEARNAVLSSQPVVHDSDMVTLLDALGDTSPEAIVARWKDTEFDGHLRIPMGYDTVDGHLIELDLGEYAVGGGGPHGCIQGTAGTGKSVLLWNMMLALAARNSPTKLNIAIGDYSGHFPRSRLKEIPHIVKVGTRTDGEESLTELERFVVDEIRRRESILFQHRAKDILEYTANLAKDQGGEPLPRLLVIVDDFYETLHHPGGLKSTLHAVSRKGRSLGIHLLLSSQIIDEAQLADVIPMLSYGVSLKVPSAHRSRTVLGTDAAAALPLGKGDALMRHHDDDGNLQVTLMRVLQLENSFDRERAALESRIIAAYESHLR